MRDSFLRAVAPALPLAQLLAEGPQIGRKLRERRRKRVSQMAQLVALTQNASS